MRLTDLRRTTSFRLAVHFSLLFGTAAALLSGFIYMQTRNYLAQRADEALMMELTAFDGMDDAQLRHLVTAQVAMDPNLQRPHTVYSLGGEYLAGSHIGPPQFNILAQPTNRPFAFTLRRNSRIVPYQGAARIFPGGQRLLVAQDMTNARAFRILLLQSCLWGGLATIVLGLVGTAAAGADAVRHIDGVTRAVQRIIGGNLSERLPTRGGHSDLNRLAHEINFMLDEIERLMLEVKGVCDNVAHDLRTPLTRLLAGLERVRRRAGTMDDYAAAVDEATEEIRELLKTFAAMLRIAEAESGVRRAGFAAIDLTQVSADVLEFYEPMAEQKGVTLGMADGASVPMLGDPSLLFEALSNLVDNALKFTPSGGRVEVRVFAEDGAQGFEVSDTGPGIPADQREAVLRRFYRAEQSRSAPGSGLGLPLVAAVARLHDMVIRIGDSNPGCRIALVSSQHSRV